MRNILLHLCILICCNSYSQTFSEKSLILEKQAEGLCFSSDGRYSALLLKNEANINTEKIAAEIIILDLLDRKILEKYMLEFSGYNLKSDIKFSSDNKFVYGISNEGFFIVNRFLKKTKIVSNRSNSKISYFEEFNKIDYVNGIFKIRGTQCKYKVTNGVNNCSNKYFIFDYSDDAFLSSSNISEEKYNNLQFLVNADYNSRIIRFNDFEYNDVEIYLLNNNEELISRHYNPTNSIVSVIVKNEKDNYQNKSGEIILFSLKKNEIIKSIPINIENKNWIMYNDGIQISDNGQTLIYSNGQCINKLDLNSGKTEQLICKDRCGFKYDCALSKIYYYDYFNIHRIEVYEIPTNNKEFLSINFTSPIEKITTTVSNKQKIDVCIGNPKLLQYKSIDYYFNGSKINNRDFEIVTNNCISSFNKVIDLQEGQNTFEVVILDNTGNKIEREKRVLNYTPKQIVTPIINPIPKVIKEKRLALVVGNSKYDNGNNLPNAANDADSLDIVLTSLNFKVIKIKNQSKQQLEAAIANFAIQLKDYDVGLFFYAGHGMEFNGDNYIIPTDAEKLDKSDVQHRCVSTSWLQEKMAEAGAYNKTNIIILDACRNNPFRSWRSFDDSNIWTPPSNIPTGTIIEYAASQGQKASDGYGSNGLYTSILLKHIKTKGLEIEKVFKRVRIDLKQKGGQDPVEINQLTNDFYFVK